MCPSSVAKISLVLLLLAVTVSGEKERIKINKDISDFNDVDMERLYEQWEQDDEPLEPDELPEHLRGPPKIDLASLGIKNPEDMIKLSKKGKTLMMFVRVKDGIEKREVDRLTGLWQTALQNNHLIAERYPLDDNRAIYMFKDGSLAWEAKDFLIEQKEVEEVTIENKPYYGKYSDHAAKEANQESKDEL